MSKEWLIPIGIAGLVYGVSINKEHPDLSLMLIASIGGLSSFFSLMKQ